MAAAGRRRGEARVRELRSSAEDGDHQGTDKQVDEDDEDGGPHDGLDGGASDALGSPGGTHTVEAAHRCNDESEAQRLDEPLKNVWITEIQVSLVEILCAVLVVHEDRDGGAAEDPAEV